MKRESDGAPGDLSSLENERQIYKSVLEGGDIPLQGLSGLKRPSSSASTKGNWGQLGGLPPVHTAVRALAAGEPPTTEISWPCSDPCPGL